MTKSFFFHFFSSRHNFWCFVSKTAFSDGTQRVPEVLVMQDDLKLEKSSLFIPEKVLELLILILCCKSFCPFKYYSMDTLHALQCSYYHTRHCNQNTTISQVDKR